MEKLSVADAVKKIRAYEKRDTLRPYFVISEGAAECAELRKNFDDFEQLSISDFCAGDSPLDTDLLVEKLNGLNRNALVSGLGEYIFFTAQEYILRNFQDKSFAQKVVFVCRGAANALERLAEEDFKFRMNHICRVDGRLELSVVKYSPEINFPTDAKNFSELLKLAEDGKNFLTVQTDLLLENVKEISNFYDVLKSRESTFAAPTNALNDEQWREYFYDDNCEGYPPEHWRSFAAGFKKKISNLYLEYVCTHSAILDSVYIRFRTKDSPKRNAPDFHCRGKTLAQFSVASRYPAPPFQLQKHILDNMTHLIELLVVVALFFAIPLGRNNDRQPVAHCIFSYLVCVVRSVSNQNLGCQVFNQGQRMFAISTRALAHFYTQGQRVFADRHMHLGVEPPFVLLIS